MWFDHLFSQRNRTTERTVWAGVAGNREVGGGGWKLDKSDCDGVTIQIPYGVDVLH